MYPDAFFLAAGLIVIQLICLGLGKAFQADGAGVYEKVYSSVNPQPSTDFSYT